jgi:pyruvate/2-oxoglutarate dehydrogenase complex dihydrolipoamide acyltransferase (E2) component
MYLKESPMAEIQVVVPDLGDFHDVAVIEILVAVGDSITAEQSLATVESDKASLEIPSSHSGIVKSLLIKLGDKVSQGSALLTLEAAESQRSCDSYTCT